MNKYAELIQTPNHLLTFLSLQSCALSDSVFEYGEGSDGSLSWSVIETSRTACGFQSCSGVESRFSEQVVVSVVTVKQ